MPRTVRSDRYTTINGPHTEGCVPRSSTSVGRGIVARIGPCARSRCRAGAEPLVGGPMLRLLQTPGWSTPGAQHDLPPTVPGWVVAFLALQGDWIGRERVAALFWPDAGNDEALNNLRVNLHRTKQLLDGWGVDATLQADRRRVRLSLPTDVAQLRQALAARRGADALALYQRPLLDGMGFPGFAALQEWFEIERADLHTAWREAMLQHALALDPLDEEAMTRQIDALVSAGREGDAQRAYVAYCRRLADELNAAP